MDLGPITINDLHGGTYRSSAISHSLSPAYTVSHSLNVNFDMIIGSAVVRNGTTLLGNQVAAGKTPLGLAEFVTSTGTTNSLVAVFSGASNASIYFYTSATNWAASNTTNLTNTAKNRFAVLGDRIYKVNGVDAFISSAGAQTWNTTNTTPILPGLIIRASNRLLAGNVPSFRSRVYFSSIIDMNASPTLTWNTQNTTGDFIDINPDDGDQLTAFANTSAFVLVFKNNGMYRLNVISKSVDADNIFNIGAVSQEAVTQCQGVTYFFSGQDIRRTTGDFPQQISRLGVQEFIDAIPQTNWTNVCAGTDGFNVYFNIGNVTLSSKKDDQVTYNNVELKFSTRDESWSVHSTGQQHRNYAQYTTSAGRTMIEADTSGNVQTMNSGDTDNGLPIFYELITQQLDSGNKAFTKTISDTVVVFCSNGQGGGLQIIPDEKQPKEVVINMNTPNGICISHNIDVTYNYMRLRWYGNSSGTKPILDGFYINNVMSEGISQSA